MSDTKDMEFNREEFLKKFIQNHSLSDEELSQISGGVFEGGSPIPKFKIGERFKFDKERSVLGDGYTYGVVTGYFKYFGPLVGWTYKGTIHYGNSFIEDDCIPEYDMIPY